MIIIDKLCYTSRLRYINADLKTAFALISLFICVIDRSIIISLLVLLAMAYLSIKKGGISSSRYIKLMRIPLFFLFLSTIAIIVNISKVPLSGFAISIGSFYLSITYSGCLFALQLILTALASVSCLYFLSLSTPITDILTVFKKMHCPSVFIELMLLIYRFIFVLLDIADALSTAQHSRLGNITFRTSMKSSGTLMSALFVRAFKKSSYLYDAMESRCYDGNIKVLTEHYPLEKRHLFYAATFELVLMILCIILRVSGMHL